MPSRFRSPTCHLSSIRLGARRSLWVQVSPSVPSRPRAMRIVSESAGIHGISQVLRRSSPCMPCPDDPGRPPESHQTDSFARASRKRKRWPPASCKQRFRGCTRPQGGAGLPYGLHGSLCTLQIFRSVCRSRLSSYGSATLGTGGWLDLTRQGLAPCKKRQACLGAHVLEAHRAASAQRVCRPVQCRGWASVRFAYFALFNLGIKS